MCVWDTFSTSVIKIMNFDGILPFSLTLFVIFNQTWGYTPNVKEIYQEMQVLKSSVKHLQWRRLVQLVDFEDTHMLRDDLTPDLPGVQYLVYTIDPDNLTSSLLEIHRLMFPDINIVLTGLTSFISKVLLRADIFDALNEFTTDLRHRSKWLLVSSDESFFALHNLNHLENVVAINLTKTPPRGTPMTLIHHPSGNVFTPVSECGADVSMCYFPNARYGYNNRRIRLMTIETGRYVIKEAINGTVYYSGYAIDILNHIASKLNLSYSITEPADGSWGIFQNGSWDGIVGHLHNKTVDLAAIDLTITKERASVVDFIYPPIRTDGISVLYKTLQANTWLTIARPLQWKVYILLLAVATIVAVMFHSLERNRSNGIPSQKTLTIYGKDPITRALFRQGTRNMPETRAGKILISFWWMFLVIVTGIYSANQAASFSSSERIHPFTTYEEIAESDYYLVNDIQGIASYNFMNSELPLLKSLAMRLYYKDFGLIDSKLEEKVARIKQEGFALLAYMSTAEFYMAEDCHLEVIKEKLFFEHLAFAVPKDSTLRSDIEKVMSILQESGTLDVLWGKWYKKRNSSTCETSRNVKPISIQTIAGSFIAVGTGVVLASIILLCERWNQFPDFLTIDICGRKFQKHPQANNKHENWLR